MKFFLMINMKMPTVVGIFIFISRKNSILGLSEHENAEFLDIFILMSRKNLMLSLREHEKSFITLALDEEPHETLHCFLSSL